MSKWKLIKALLMLGINIALLVIAAISIREFFMAELIVDKIHYGFILTFVMIYFNDSNGNNNGGKLATN